MLADHQAVNSIEPPVLPPENLPADKPNNWFSLAPDSPVVEYLAANLWDRPQPPSHWEAARLSNAAYIYREKDSRWQVVAKFYAAKTGPTAEKFARREYDCTQQAQSFGLSAGDMRALHPLAAWRGVLFLEYVDGLTLEDSIAIRRNRPGVLDERLERAARLLAKLHAHSLQPGAQFDFKPEADYARQLLDELYHHGVLAGDPVVRDGLLRQIERWKQDKSMTQAPQVFIHGDATTSNFIFAWDGSLVAIDWERFHVADPAAELGRLLAEVSHSIKQYGGSVAEAQPLLEHLTTAYCQALPTGWDTAALLRRTRFYQASSTLRIARNGWISPLDRTALVAQAQALLG